MLRGVRTRKYVFAYLINNVQMMTQNRQFLIRHGFAGSVRQCIRLFIMFAQTVNATSGFKA